VTAGTGSRGALVQGASGGLGLALVRRLLERGAGPVIGSCREPEASGALGDLVASHPDRFETLRLDVCDESSIERAAGALGERGIGLELLVNASGLLHRDALQPEKRLEQVSADGLRRVFEVNAFGPLLVARHFLPLLDHGERTVLANLSARVGSIGDNRLGGWYAYRSSKAALNMMTKTLAIELRRRAPQCVCVALHPGTVDTALSRPFQRGVDGQKLFSPERAARQLLDVIDALTPEDSGGFRAWDGSGIEW